MTLLFGRWSLLNQQDQGAVWLILVILLTGFMFVVFRVLIFLWIRWNRMRKQRLIWSFTHMQILIVGFAVALGTVVFMIDTLIRLSRQEEPFTTIRLFLLDATNQVLPVIGAVFVSALLLILMLVPPLALFSYLLVRGTIRRLEDLAAGTAALRQGKLSTRIEVSGEDEVAQLQNDFNNMAADMEQAMADLEQERDRVTGLLRAQRELTATVSHELRTPIATIQGYLEPALTHTVESSESNMHHDLTIISTEFTRLRRLIDDLFALSRAEVEQLTLSWRQRRVDITFQPKPGEHSALVDAVRLEQVLTNLIHNAVQHTPPGGIVSVVVGTDSDQVYIDVRDTGMGIAEKDLPFIWDPFYRGQDAGRDDNGRSGLGLALVKALTEAMGGTVGVESQSNQGSCFELRYPKA